MSPDLSLRKAALFTLHLHSRTKLRKEPLIAIDVEKSHDSRRSYHEPESATRNPLRVVPASTECEGQDRSPPPQSWNSHRLKPNGCLQTRSPSQIENGHEIGLALQSRPSSRPQSPTIVCSSPGLNQVQSKDMQFYGHLQSSTGNLELRARERHLLPQSLQYTGTPSKLAYVNRQTANSEPKEQELLLKANLPEAKTSRTNGNFSTGCTMPQVKQSRTHGNFQRGSTMPEISKITRQPQPQHLPSTEATRTSKPAESRSRSRRRYVIDDSKHKTTKRRYTLDDGKHQSSTISSVKRTGSSQLDKDVGSVPSFLQKLYKILTLQSKSCYVSETVLKLWTRMENVATSCFQPFSGNRRFQGNRSQTTTMLDKQSQSPISTSGIQRHSQFFRKRVRPIAREGGSWQCCFPGSVRTTKISDRSQRETAIEKHEKVAAEVPAEKVPTIKIAKAQIDRIRGVTAPNEDHSKSISDPYSRNVGHPSRFKLEYLQRKMLEEKVVATRHESMTDER